RPRLRLDQRLVRMPCRDVVVDDRRAITQRLRRRSVCLDCHNQLLAQISKLCPTVREATRRNLPFVALQILCVLRHLLARPQSYIRLLPVGAIPGKLPAPSFFSRIHRRADGKNLNLENRLHRLLHFRLRRSRSHLEDQRVLVFLDRQTFFGDHRTANNLVCGFHQATSAAFSCRTRFRGEADAFFAPSSSSFAAFGASTISTVDSTFNASSAARNSLVFGSFTSNAFTTVNLPSQTSTPAPN